MFTTEEKKNREQFEVMNIFNVESLHMYVRLCKYTTCTSHYLWPTC